MSEQSTPATGDQHPEPYPPAPGPPASQEAPVSGDDIGLSRPRRPLPRSAVGRALRTRADRRLRARRVRRLVRHVEPWSVLKVSVVLYLCAWVVMLFVGVTLWNLAVSSGLVSRVESFVVELFALESFTINADQIFRIAAVGGLLMVLAGSGLTVLAAVLFNLISDVTGGVRLTVVEEETARPRPRRARRRVLVAAPPPVGAPAPVVAPEPDGAPPRPKVAADG